MKDLLAMGENVATIDVSSHTEKQMNDTERKNFPGSVTHLNVRSGLAFFLRCELGITAAWSTSERMGRGMFVAIRRERGRQRILTKRDGGKRCCSPRRLSRR